jgi:selenoprotein W-related protein
LAAAIKDHCGLESELISSGGGVFEVEIDGELVFSKKEKGHFPENEEILDLIDSRK